MARGEVDIILIQAPAWGIVAPPLSLGLLSSVLKENGNSVWSIDMNIEMYRRRSVEFEDAWGLSYGLNIWEKPMLVKEFMYSQRAYLQKTVRQILNCRPKIVGFSVFLSNITASRFIAEELKKRDKNLRIVFGGFQVAKFKDSKSLLREDDNIDAIVLGEGENTIVELADMFCKDKPLSAVAGTYIKVDGEIIEGEKRTPVKNLDSIPFPDFSGMDLSMYTHLGSLNTYFTRGCLNRCIYCNERDFMGPFRSRSGKRVFDEVVYLVNKYPGTNYFRFLDSVTNGNIKELEAFCNLLIENNVKIEWVMENACIRREMRTPLYKKLKKAGCEMISYGLETASDSLREAVGKRLAKGVDAEKVIREGAEADIKMVPNFMFGLPGETSEDFEMQNRFIKRNRKYFDMITPSLWFCYFPKGSLGYENPDKYSIDLSTGSPYGDISLGSLFWESKDGKNNYLVRMERCLEFCDLASKLNIRSLHGYPPIRNMHELRGDYFFSHGDFMQAKNEYNISLNTEAKNPDVTSKLIKCHNNLGLDSGNPEVTNKKSLPEGKVDHDLQSLREISDEIEELKESLKLIKETANKSEIPKGLNIISRLKYSVYIYLRKNVLVHIVEPIYTKFVYRVVSSLEVIDEQIKAIKANHDLPGLKEISDEIKELKQSLNLIKVTANKPEIPKGLNAISRLKYYLYLHSGKSIVVHIIEPIYERFVYRVVSSLEVIDQQIKAIQVNHDRQSLREISDEIEGLFKAEE